MALEKRIEEFNTREKESAMGLASWAAKSREFEATKERLDKFQEIIHEQQQKLDARSKEVLQREQEVARKEKEWEEWEANDDPDDVSEPAKKQARDASPVRTEISSPRQSVGQGAGGHVPATPAAVV